MLKFLNYVSFFLLRFIESLKILNPQNACKKKFWIEKIPTRKNFGSLKAWCHDGTRPMRPTMAQYLLNSAHSKNISVSTGQVRTDSEKVLNYAHQCFNSDT